MVISSVLFSSPVMLVHLKTVALHENYTCNEMAHVKTDNQPVTNQTFPEAAGLLIKESLLVLQPIDGTLPEGVPRCFPASSPAPWSFKNAWRVGVGVVYRDKVSF